MREGHWVDIALTEYHQALAWQLYLHHARVMDDIHDTLMLTEHLPVYTLGRTARSEHVREAGSSAVTGIPTYTTDRGGSVTYHGPGQLIGYPVLRLRTYCDGPKMYMRMLEEVLIRALKSVGLSSQRQLGMPGVWIRDRKIAALGVRISQGVTRHGFALNVINDLEPFSRIVPCGLYGYQVTSIAAELGINPAMETMKEQVIEAFQQVFEISFARQEIQALCSAATTDKYLVHPEGGIQVSMSEK